MLYAGTYTGTLHTYCADFDTTDPITFEIESDETVDFPYSYLQDGKIDGSGNVLDSSITVNSRSLGTLKIPYSGSDNGTYFSVSGRSSNGIVSTIQANLVPLPPSPITTTDNGDGTHTITGSRDGLTLQSIHDDLMTGGGVRETFVFTPGFGQSEITDFIASGRDHDIVDLSGSRLHTLAQVIRHTTMADGTATIHLNLHDSITLDGVSKAQLKAHPHDFAFG